jgi:hypothetical protein
MKSNHDDDSFRFHPISPCPPLALRWPYDAGPENTLTFGCFDGVQGHLLLGMAGIVNSSPRENGEDQPLCVIRTKRLVHAAPMSLGAS